MRKIFERTRHGVTHGKKWQGVRGSVKKGNLTLKKKKCIDGAKLQKGERRKKMETWPFTVGRGEAANTVVPFGGPPY